MIKSHTGRPMQLVALLTVAAIMLGSPVLNVAGAYAAEGNTSLAESSNEDQSALIARIKNTSDYPKMQKIYDTMSCGSAAGSAPGWGFICSMDVDDDEATLQRVVEEVYPPDFRGI